MARLSTEQRKEQITKAVLKIIAGKGVSGVTVSELAREVGLSEGALFRHYSSKKEIIRATVDMVQSTLTTGVRQTAQLNITAKEKLYKLLQFHLNFLGQNRGIPRVMFSEQVFQDDSELKKRLAKTMHEYQTILKEIYAQGVSEGVFKKNINMQMAVLSYFGLLQTSAFMWFMSDYSWDITERHQQIYNYLIFIWGTE